MLLQEFPGIWTVLAAATFVPGGSFGWHCDNAAAVANDECAIGSGCGWVTDDQAAVATATLVSGGSFGGHFNDSGSASYVVCGIYSVCTWGSGDSAAVAATTLVPHGSCGWSFYNWVAVSTDKINGFFSSSSCYLHLLRPVSKVAVYNVCQKWTNSSPLC